MRMPAGPGGVAELSGRCVCVCVTVFPEGCFLVKADIKEFFMSGDSEDISSDAMALYGQGPRRRVLNDALELLLSSQWVDLPRGLLQGSKLRVIRGSGMGRRHSGNLAGAAFAWSMGIGDTTTTCCSSARIVLSSLTSSPSSSEDR